MRQRGHIQPTGRGGLFDFPSTIIRQLYAARRLSISLVTTGYHSCDSSTGMRMISFERCNGAAFTRMEFYLTGISAPVVGRACGCSGIRGYFGTAEHALGRARATKEIPLLWVEF